MKPDWKFSATGMYPLPISRHPTCIHCKEPLAKRHGLNQNRPGQEPTVMGWMLFGTGPYCLWCTQKSWSDPDFMTRSGSKEYFAHRYDLTRL